MADVGTSKQERTAAKRKVTVVCSRIKKVILQNRLPTPQIQAIAEELEISYIDFTCRAEEFATLLKEDPTLVDQHAKVNDQDPEEYASNVEALYQEAKDEFDVYISKVKEAEALKEEQAMVKKVATGIRLVKNKLMAIVRRDNTDMDLVELEEDREEVEGVVKEMMEMMVGLDDIPVVAVDWKAEKESLEELIGEGNEMKRKLNVRMRKGAAPDEEASEAEVPIHPADSHPPAPVTTSTTYWLLQDSTTSASINTADILTSSLSPLSLSSCGLPLSPPVSSQGLSSFPTQSGFSGVYSPPALSLPGHHSSSSLGQFSRAPSSVPGLPNQSTSSFLSSPMGYLNPAASQHLYSTPGLLNPAASLPQMSSLGMLNFASQPSYTVPGLQSPVSGLPYQSSLGAFSQPSSSVYGLPNSAANQNPGNLNMPAYRSDVKVRRTELPHFSGLRKDWPEFKNLWFSIAIPAVQCRQALAKELKECCKNGSAKELIWDVPIVGPSSADVMWTRLTEFYEDATAAVTEVMRTLQELRIVKPEDYRGLTAFVRTVESSYIQLATINRLNYVTIREVDNLCNLLPVSVKEGWHERHLKLNAEEQLHPFAQFTEYLLEKRRAVSRLVDIQPVVSTRKKEVNSHGTRSQEKQSPAAKKKVKWKCAVHKDSELVKHVTENCTQFMQMSRDEKYAALKSVHGCFRCFGDHPRGKCRYKEPCGSCGKTGHHTLMCIKEEANHTQSVRPPPHIPTTSHSTNSLHVPTTSHHTNSDIVPVERSVSTHASHNKSTGLYAIFSVAIVGAKYRCNVFADDGSDASYITNSAARRLGAKRLLKYLLLVTTTGGQDTQYEAQEYELELITVEGRRVPVKMFGMTKITSEVASLDMNVVSELFPDHEVSGLQRKSNQVDVLLGTDYFGLHPKKEIGAAGENLSIMQGSLGVCLQGSHPLIKAVNKLDSNMVKVLKSVTVLQCESHNSSLLQVQHPLFSLPLVELQSHHSLFTPADIESYVKGEEIGIHSHQKCGSCKCGKCPQPGHTFSFQEEVELNIIRENLHYDEGNSCWITKYPWKFDPHLLPDNQASTFSALVRLEKKLQKDPDTALKHHEQILDMVKRGAARKLSIEEIQQYDGPKFYITHLGAPNPKSKSTPYRIVFNSSMIYKGVSLNNWLYKGPDAYMNNQLATLLRWREEVAALVGDITKMFNSVHLENQEQHCHRFLWRGLDSNSSCDTYVMTRVNMGDRPAGSISTEALYKTAERFGEDCPRAAEMIKVGSYVDDLLDSVPSKEEAISLSEGCENMLKKGGFKIKFWVKSGDVVEDEDGITTILGICWKSEPDTMVFSTSLNFSPKKHGVHVEPDLLESEVPGGIPSNLTKRMVLSQMMRIYDPMGLVCAFTLKGKMLLRETWEKKLGWDESLPDDLRGRWVHFMCILYDLRKLEYPRSIKPPTAEGDPMLVLLSDASDKAYGFMAFARWLCTDGTYQSRFIMAKNRIAPLVKRSTPQLELNAAVLSKRGREVIEREMRYKFSRVLHIVDSEIVLAMLHKTSTRFKLYEGVRVGEIQAANKGDISDWAWVAGTDNTADWLTRGKNPADLSEGSEWFCGPSFLSKPVEQWGLQFIPSSDIEVIGEKKLVASNAAECQRPFINYHNFHSYRKLVRTLARVINMFMKKKLVAVKENLNVMLLERAEKVIIQDVQKSIKEECEKTDRKGRIGGKFYRLKPTQVKGFFMVGTRLNFNPMVPENESQYLLPADHPVTTLLIIQSHRDSGHRNRDSTVARFRQKFWSPQASKIASSVVNNCKLCRLRKPKLMSQRMGLLPEVRSKPAPAFTYVMIDYFGHFLVRGDVQKRITGKAWGIIFTDLVSRAVHLESVYEYGTDAFLVAFGNFANIRGYPRIIYSDPGSNLTCASKELSQQWKEMWKDDQKINDEAVENGVEWKFTVADAPWQNGAVESLVKTCKKSLNFSMQHQRLSPSEFRGVLLEVMNTVNERPMGILSSSDSDYSVLTPNCLLMGRSTSKNPGGWHPSNSKLERFHLVQQISNAFWKQWIQTCAPALVIDEKWHAKQDDIHPGDVVLVLDSDSLRAEYRLALVKEVYPGADGSVRNVKISYRRYKVKDTAVTYTGSSEQCCLRPVQRLVLIASQSDVITHGT